MEKWFSGLNTLLGLVALAALTLLLVTLFSQAANPTQAGQLVSPIETPQPTFTVSIDDLQSAPTPLPGTPRAAPLPGSKEFEELESKKTPKVQNRTKATAIARATPYTPSPPKMPKLYTVRSPEDAIAAALDDPFVKGRLASECRKGAEPSTPIYVHNISEGADENVGYYLVPFYKENYIVLTVVVNTMGDQGVIGMIAECSCSTEAVATRKANPRATPQERLQVSAETAKVLVEEKGYQTKPESRLVWRRLWEGADKFSPSWEFRTADDKVIYVIARGYDVRVYRADQVHSFD